MLAPDTLPAFALAKIQPPRPRSGLVARPDLERTLDHALRQHRLTLLVAPAGYGKTAALTRQIRGLPADCALAWISADEDDHLQRFLACLSTALAPHRLPWRVAPEALATLAQAEGGLRGVAYELVNALAGAPVARGLIVIDDVHRIADPQVFELLQTVLDRLPEPWAVAMASRVDPPLSLARWRANGDLAELRQYELRFRRDEVDALLAGSATPDADAQALLSATDGWAAGLRLTLSALATQRGPAPAAGTGARGLGAPAQRHLFDYLASEVLDDMPEALRWFLLRCSVLPELTAARCAHVARLPHTARLLEEVERRGLFVTTLDADELTLRLHDLFRDFLESRLQRDFPEELPWLLKRAADHEGDLSRAVGYLLRAGAWEPATQLLAERGPALIMQGGGPALEQMLAHFPEDELAQRPDLQLLRGLAAFPRFDFDAMVQAMAQAAAGFARDGREVEATLAQAYACLGRQNTGQMAEAVAGLDALRARPLDEAVRPFVCFACAWAAYAQGRAGDVAGHVAEMLDALARTPQPQAWDRCFFLSILTGIPGMQPLLERFAQQAMRLGGDRPTQLRAGALHIRTWQAFGRADLDAAAEALARADEDCRWLGQPRSLMTENWMAHTLIGAVRGDRARAYAAAEENRRDMTEHALPANRLTHLYENLFTAVRAAWILGDADRLRALAPELMGCANGHEWQAAADDRQMLRAMLALLDGDLAAARMPLQALAAQGERSCFHPAAQATMMLADTEARLGLADTAAATLRPWLDAVRQGERAPGGALLAGPAVLQRLAAVAWGGRLDEAGQALLRQLATVAAAGAAGAGPSATDGAAAHGPAGPAAGGALPAASGAAAAPADPALARLTERERAVLARMAAGDSNKLIARAFDLSPHTVKRHVANILDKLGVASRGQAAARWRQPPAD